MTKPIYLDYAAATPMDSAVLKTMEPYFTDHFHNPSATYLAGRAMRQAISEARASVGRQLGARPAEVIFTAGATEANNLAIQGVMRQFPDGEVLTSAIEHESVLAPAELFKNRRIPVTKAGIVDLAALAKMITDSTVLISVMWVNNELGTLQPLREVAALIKAKRQERQRQNNLAPLLLHSDGAQAGNYFDLHISRLGVDMLSLNGSKIYGPKQSGALFVKTGTPLAPLIVGGGQEMNRRSGTENVPGIIGLAKALEMAQARRATEAPRVKQLRNLFIKLLQQQTPEAVVNGSVKLTAPHIVSVTFRGFDNERLMMELDEQGIQCATGSACSAANVEPSYVLAAIGLTDKLARASLRFSFGRRTTEEDVTHTVKALATLTSGS